MATHSKNKIHSLAQPARKSFHDLGMTLFGQSRDIILLIRFKDGRILEANPAAEQAYGYTRMELVAMMITELRPPDTQPQVERQMEQVNATGVLFETLHKRKDGTIFPVEISSIGTEFEGERANLSIIRDITERKNNLVEIEKSEEQLRALIESNPLGMHQYELRPDDRLVLIGANPAADRILGLDHRKMIGLTIEDAFPTHRQTEIPMIYRRVARDGEPYACEQIAYQDTSIQGVYEIHAFQTGPSQMAVLFQEITEKIKALNDMRESEEKFRTLIEQNSEGVVMLDEQGRIIEWNAAQERSSGIPRQEALGRLSWELQFQVMPPDRKTPTLYEAMKENGKKLLQTAESIMFYKPVDISINKPDGTQVIIQQTSFPIKTKAGFRIGSLMRDITGQKQAEKDLKRRMVELEALHDVALAGTEAASINDLLERVARIVREKLFPDHFDVAFIDKETNALVYQLSDRKNTSLQADQNDTRTDIDSAVVLSGIPMRVEDTLLIPNFTTANPDTRSELCVPIIISGQVTGAVILENGRPGSFSEADERLAVAIAGELGTAIEKIRLLEEEHNRRLELEALEAVSAVLNTEKKKDEVLQDVLERVMSVLNLEGASFVFRDPQSGELVTDLHLGNWSYPKGIHLPKGVGIGYQVATTQHFYLNNQINSEPPVSIRNPTLRNKCLLCLALLVDGQTHGLLFLGRNTDFTPRDVHLAIAIADTLAGALHRIELHAETQRQMERLMTLRAIDQSILSRLNLEETLAVLLEKITGQLQVDAANFLLYQPKNQLLVAAAERGLPSNPIWNMNQELLHTHPGRAALSRQIEFIQDLGQFNDGLTEKIREIGENFLSYAAVPLVAKGELKGVLQLFNHARLSPTPDWMGFLEALADQAAIAINSAQLFNEQQQTNERLTRAYEDTIDGWSRALALRDEETEGHSQRVTDLTMMLARRMGYQEDQMAHIRRGAKLHDIGKMGIPDSILLKPGPLTDDEREVMQKHPIFAANLLYPIEFLSQALEIPYGHHEKWDGTGYPQGARGEDIPLSARIFAIVDVWDALTTDRPYRKAWPVEKTLAYILAQSGKHFDPQVVKVFIALMGEKYDFHT